MKNIREAAVQNILILKISGRSSWLIYSKLKQLNFDQILKQRGKPSYSVTFINFFLSQLRCLFAGEGRGEVTVNPYCV